MKAQKNRNKILSKDYAIILLKDIKETYYYTGNRMYSSKEKDIEDHQ